MYFMMYSMMMMYVDVLFDVDVLYDLLYDDLTAILLILQEMLWKRREKARA